MPSGVPFGLPTDQRLDEANSLVYTSEPLADELTILGWPRAILHVSSSVGIMAFGAALCDVAPDGTSAVAVSRATREAHLGRDEKRLIPL